MYTGYPTDWSVEEGNNALFLHCSSTLDGVTPCLTVSGEDYRGTQVEVLYQRSYCRNSRGSLLDLHGQYHEPTGEEECPAAYPHCLGSGPRGTCTLDAEVAFIRHFGEHMMINEVQYPWDENNYDATRQLSVGEQLWERLTYEGEMVKRLDGSWTARLPTASPWEIGVSHNVGNLTATYLNRVVQVDLMKNTFRSSQTVEGNYRITTGTMAGGHRIQVIWTAPLLWATRPFVHGEWESTAGAEVRGTTLRPCYPTICGTLSSTRRERRLVAPRTGR